MGTEVAGAMSGVRELDAMIRARHLLKHPLYRAWSCGELPIETLRSYASQYYQFESNFPRYVGGVYARLSDPAARRLLLENLIDEEGRSPTHPELWLQFARGIGVTRHAVEAAPPKEGTRALLREYEHSTLDGSSAQGLGALYAYESIFPEIAAEKSRGLRAYYGVRDRTAHEFFRVHTFADVEHARAERALLGREIGRGAANERAARRGVRGAIDAWWNFLTAFGA